MQYLAWYHSYHAAVKYALSNPGYRARAKAFAQSHGLLDGLAGMKVGRGMSKADIKAEEQAILTKVLEENLNIT